MLSLKLLDSNLTTCAQPVLKYNVVHDLTNITNITD